LLKSSKKEWKERRPGIAKTDATEFVGEERKRISSNKRRSKDET